MDYHVFGIGFNKTATRSLHAACKILGLRSLHDPHQLQAIMLDNYKSGNSLMKGMEEYNCYFDMGFWSIDIAYQKFIQCLDDQYPNSKFILHTRDVDSWINSLKEHNTRRNSRKRWPFGSRRIVDDEWKHAKICQFEYCQYIAREYFKYRPEQFLEINVVAGDGWEKLCSFLEVDLPKDEDGKILPFPKKNVAEEIGSS